MELHKANDANLGDGTGIMNVAHGVQTLTWGGLVPGTPYYFVIYPYTNAGALIDYKTTPDAPTATATTLANSTTPLAAWTFDVSLPAPNTPTVVLLIMVLNPELQHSIRMVRMDHLSGIHLLLAMN